MPRFATTHKDHYETVRKALLEKRALSASTLKTYTSLLMAIFKKHLDIHNKDEPFSIDWFKDVKHINAMIKDDSLNSRNTKLAALSVLLGEGNAYSKLIYPNRQAIVAETEQNKKTEKQEKSWVSQEQIQKLLEMLRKDTLHLWKKNTLDDQDLQMLQNYIILACVSGAMGLEPRRLTDWVGMEIRNFTDKEEAPTNAYAKGSFVFENYKTSEQYGTQIIKLPIKLNNIVKKWVAINPTNYLFFDRDKKSISNVTLNQRLNRIFSKIGVDNVGINILRHSYLSELYKDIPSIAEMKDRASNMGHSMTQALEYVKK